MPCTQYKRAFDSRCQLAKDNFGDVNERTTYGETGVVGALLSECKLGKSTRAFSFSQHLIDFDHEVSLRAKLFDFRSTRETNLLLLDWKRRTRLNTLKRDCCRQEGTPTRLACSVSRRDDTAGEGRRDACIDDFRSKSTSKTGSLSHPYGAFDARIDRKHRCCAKEIDSIGNSWQTPSIVLVKMSGRVANRRHLL